MSQYEGAIEKQPKSETTQRSAVPIVDKNLQIRQATGGAKAPMAIDGEDTDIGHHATAPARACSSSTRVPVSPELPLRASALHPTRHASKRQQQRCIPSETLTLLQLFGRQIYDHRGGYWLLLDRLGRQRVRQSLGKTAAQINLDVYAVLDADEHDRVITVGHRTKRLKTNASNQGARKLGRNYLSTGLLRAEGHM